MNIKQVKDTVKKIKEISGDSEYAHGVEDDLYRDFVKHVSESKNKKLSNMAKEVLKTKDMDFERWYA